MIYIYDVLLNFSETLIEFFEWDTEDKIEYIKKIPVFKVKEETMNNIIKYETVVDDSFFSLIKNNTSFYESETKESFCLLTDKKQAIGIKILKDKTLLLSHMLLDEENEVIKLYNRLELLEEQIPNAFSFKKTKRKSNPLGYTRYELKIIKSLKEEFNSLYKNNKIEKLNYYYYEYFNKYCNEKQVVYKSLVDSINNDFNEKHINIYNIMCLSKNI